jgi:hypothetical protein
MLKWHPEQSEGSLIGWLITQIYLGRMDFGREVPHCV